MNIKIYQVDAFTDRLFAGNPAAVCLLTAWIDDHLLQSIAQENNLSETAFVVPTGPMEWHIRWFTPTVEVDLCGHATLAAAHVIYASLEEDAWHVTFRSHSGLLTVSRLSHETYMMDFPSDPLTPVEDKTAIADALGTTVSAAYRGRDDYLAILPDESAILKCQPDLIALSHLSARGVIISAPGISSDISSRCFYPCVGVDEDPVTGSAHTTLTTYWAHRLRKNRFSARQLSARGGTIECIYKASRVALIGTAVTYLEGHIILPS